MADPCWIIERESGEVLILPHAPTKADGDYVRMSRSSRLPDPNGCEDWSFERRRWIVNADRALAWADRQHVSEHGAYAIQLAHATKAIEARLILAGQAIEGIVAAEARQQGVPVADLARTIADKADAAIAPELARIAARAKVRAAAPAVLP